MARFLLITIVLVVALIVYTNADTERKCYGQNEEWKVCGACDDTCEGRVGCAAVCRIPGSCGCKPGYVRNNERKCILKENCPKTPICGRNERWYPCGACDSKCGIKVNCILSCREGSCGCEPGYVRNDRRECILENRCPKPLICGDNEEVKGCGACDSTCENDIACTLDCRPPQCGCKADHVRDDKGKCILKSSCPKH